jgi:SAM-dependent methyltransferase
MKVVWSNSGEWLAWQNSDDVLFSRRVFGGRKSCGKHPDADRSIGKKFFFWNKIIFLREQNVNMSNDHYVQYGCGFSAPVGWKNFDASLTLAFERLPLVGRLYIKNESRFPENVEYGDIVKGLPVAHDSCKGVYCSHILEHLSFNDFKVALSNTYKILQPGGIFRLVLPDLEYSVRHYLSDPSSDAASAFMRETYLGNENRPRGLKNLVISWLGNSQHLWMWDYKSIEQELNKAGFVVVRRAFFGDSSDAMFFGVEERSRWDNCLGVECKKPI